MKSIKPYKWYIVGGVVLLLVILGISSYNGLVSADENVNEKWAKVETAYQARLDKLKNLVPTVREAAKYEGSTIENVTKARTGAPQELLEAYDEASKAQGGDAVKNEAAQARLSKALDDYKIYVNAVHEAYPDLKAVQNFLALQDEITAIESNIQYERTQYTEAVKAYNTKIRKFPASIFAGIFGFDRREQYKAQEGAEYAPDVNEMLQQ